jgi:serine protease Do
VLKLNWKKSVSVMLTTAMAVGVAWAPSTALMAQTPFAAVRGLPDFTDLVEQVGPSVVNIRTLEKVRPTGPAGSAADEEMQELFRRFFGVPMPNAPRQAPRQNRPQEEAQPRTPRTRYEKEHCAGRVQ